MTHPRKEHAPFSPSAASRWIACPAAARVAHLTPREDTPYSILGDTLHSIAEEAIKKQLERPAVEAMMLARKVQDPASRSLSTLVDMVMIYVDYVRELSYFCTCFEVEHKVKIKGTDCYGTIDAMVVTDDLYIIDFKTGTGTNVMAEDNYQLLTYAIGALRDPRTRGIRNVRLVIVQPGRHDELPPILSWETTVEYVRDHEERVIAAIKAGKNFKAAPVAGSHCRWCPARARCYAFAQHSCSDKLDVVLDSQKLPPEIPTLSPTDMGLALSQEEKIKQWFSALREYCSQPENVPPQWKLVEAKTNRKWSLDPASVPAFLAENSLPENLYDVLVRVEPRMQALTAVTKLLEEYPVLKSQIFKPEGQPVLAPVSDSRPAIFKNQPQFADVSAADIQGIQS